MTPDLWTPDRGVPDGILAREGLPGWRQREQEFLREQRERERERYRHIRDPRVEAWTQHAGINYIQKATGIRFGGAQGQTLATDTPVVLLAGRCNVVGVGWADNADTRTVTGVSDLAGNTYTDCGVGRLTLASSVGYMQVFVAPNCIAHSANIVTVTWDAATADYQRLIVREYAGVRLVNPVDVTASATAANASSVTSSSFTPTTATGAAVNFTSVNVSGTGVFSVGANYANLEVLANAGVDKLGSQDRLNAPASSQTAAMSADSNKWWGSIVVVLFAEPELTSVPMRGRGLRPAPFKPGGDYFQKPRIH